MCRLGLEMCVRVCVCVNKDILLYLYKMVIASIFYLPSALIVQ